MTVLCTGTLHEKVLTKNIPLVCDLEDNSVSKSDGYVYFSR